MAQVATTTKVQNGYKIRNIEPQAVRNAPPSERLIYWGWVVEFGLKRKDRELSQGLDKDGNPLRPISARTRKYRRSAMTPSGRGSPTAPPLTPGYQKSRTRSLLTGRAFTTHADFWWRFDAWTGQSWGDILSYQAEEGRDVFGLSPDGVAWVKLQADAKWSAYRRGEQPAPPKAQAVAPRIRGGSYDLSEVDLGIGTERLMGLKPGEWSGLRSYEEWQAYWRESAVATIPGRPGRVKSPHPQVGPNYNRLLQQVWGVAPKAPGPRTAKPIVPKPTPIIPGRPAPVIPPKPTPAPTVSGYQPSQWLNTVKAGANRAEIERVAKILDSLHVTSDMARIDVITDAGPGNQGRFQRGMYKQPESIGVIEGANHPGQTFAHEFGHFVEMFGIPGHESGERNWDGKFRNKILDEWHEAIQGSQAFKNLDALYGQKDINDKVLEYLLRYDELWARSYSQWVATRSGDSALMQGIDYYRSQTGQLGANRQWSDEDFRPIAAAIDNLFRTLKWLR